MEWSYYNELITGVNGTKYLFNCRTSNWIEFDRNIANPAIDLSTNPEIIKYLNPNLYKILINEKFIVPSTLIETQECFHEIIDLLDSKKSIKITINPTLDCNLKCWYCYETLFPKSSMSRETIESICKYLTILINSNQTEFLHISFFGGEPLIRYQSVIRHIIKKILALVAKTKINIHFSFTTNGICLNQIVVNDLICLVGKDNISIQTAIDGNRILHNKVKYLKNGYGSYDIVKRNIEYAVKNGIRVTLRCNYTLSNISSYLDVVKDFEQFHHYPNLRFSFHKVWQEKDSDELHHKIQTIKDQLCHYSINSNLKTFWSVGFDKCYGDYRHNYIINYNGVIFKCTARDFNETNRIGYLKPDGQIQFTELGMHRQNKIFSSQCMYCRRLPICPICSQIKFESKDNTCPIRIDNKCISANIRTYFSSISNITAIEYE